MGTNYYLHLGKRSSLGAGQGCRFTWAVYPYPADQGGSIDAGLGVTVQDEYGKELTWAEFRDLVKDDQRDDTAIGQAFT